MIEEARRRGRHDRARAGRDVMGRLQRRLPRPRRARVGDRPQPVLDARARRLDPGRMSVEHTGGGDLPLGPVDPLVVPRLRRARDVRPAPATRPGRPVRRRDLGRAVRQRRHLPAGRPLRARRRSARAHAWRAGTTRALDVHPFRDQQVADAGDVGVTPFDLDEAIAADRGRRSLRCSPTSRTWSRSAAITPWRSRSSARSHARYGPVALVHFDAHLDTWDTYFGAAYTHGTPFRRAFEEGLLAPDRCAHVGIRGPLFSPEDLVDDAGFGFTVVGAFDYLDTDARRRRGRARGAGRATRRSTCRSTST